MIICYNTHHGAIVDGRRFVSGSKDGTARIVEHGLVL